MRLATWNLEHFWPVADHPLLIRKNGDATRLRSQRFLERTRDAVRSLEADVLCLQEIDGLPSLAFLAPDHQHFAEARLDPTLPPHERRHGIGFAIGKDVPVKRLPDIPLSTGEGSDGYARDALVLEIREQALLVGLHLKSGCRDKLRLDKRAPCKILQAQVGLLCAWMAQQTLPLILMGDFNRVLSQPRDSVLKQLITHQNLRLAPVTFRQVDHILAPASWTLTPAGPKGLKGFSDHRPLCFDCTYPGK